MIDEDLMTLFKPKPCWLKSIANIEHTIFTVIKNRNLKCFFLLGVVMDVDGPGATSDVPVEPDPYSSCSAGSAFTSDSGSTSGSALVFKSGSEIVAVVVVVVEGIAPPSFID
jgi:hypothetical protein